MPDIGDMHYGTSGSGAEAYLEAIHSILLQKAASALTEELDEINKACDQHWEGEAKEKFKRNIREDAEHVKRQYEALYTVLGNEILSASAAMIEKDKRMFD